MAAVARTHASPLTPGPIAGPAAWTGPRIAQHTEWLTELTDMDLDEIDKAIRTHFAQGREMGDISAATFRLPTLAEKLRILLKQVLHGCGFMMLRGFPVDRYSVAESAVAYLGIGAHLGSFRSQNAKGHLLGHVCDLGFDIKRPTTRYYQTRASIDN